MLDLKCFDRITISKPSVSKNSVSATYTLYNNHDSWQFNLKFRYDEELEELEELAGLIVTMPVINYGLFTDIISLDFEMDPLDLRFMEDLLEVTATDIFVNKLCRRRADFIKKQFIPAQEDIKLENAHNRARIEAKLKNKINSKRDFSPNRSAVLSSGGKESLLTYGLLKELKKNVYPVFFNESGGHWRTAVKAYNEFKKFDKNTRRVWSNVDRFYLFMLDHMKIIREDHRSVKADTYPIRLFIFGPYIFSILPYVLKYKIGNILLGNEYDDPIVSAMYEGIPHYFGIYDQSEEFDRYMSSYYSKKGWEIKQWSIVRPLYGLVVERILTQRYPDLFELQRSCHSCHIEDSEIVPCGSCTKCLGVLSFILANDQDPGKIRYKKEHIESFEKNLNKTQLRLDQEEREHVFYLLSKKGYKVQGKEHEHVEMLHFDNQNSTFDHIPESYRRVFEIYKKYVKGSVMLKDKKFIKVEMDWITQPCAKDKKAYL